MEQREKKEFKVFIFAENIILQVNPRFPQKTFKSDKRFQ